MDRDLDLGARTEAVIADWVAEGRYASREDMLRDAVEHLVAVEAKAHSLAALATDALHEAEQMGFIDAETVFERLKARYAEWPRAAE
jgi:antitoxin ParD1/3/4